MLVPLTLLYHLAPGLPLQAHALVWPFRVPSYTSRKDNNYLLMGWTRFLLKQETSVAPCTRSLWGERVPRTNMKQTVRSCEQEKKSLECLLATASCGLSSWHQPIALLSLVKSLLLPSGFFSTSLGKCTPVGGKWRKTFSPNSLTNLFLLQLHFSSLDCSKDAAKNC